MPLCLAAPAPASTATVGTHCPYYLLGKFARVVLVTSEIDDNGRFCMSSAAAGAMRAFGLDRGLPFPPSDLGEADCTVLGSRNLAETTPPVVQHLTRAPAAVGVRRGSTTTRLAPIAAATLHL